MTLPVPGRGPVGAATMGRWDVDEIGVLGQIPLVRVIPSHGPVRFIRPGITS